jgi:16S rRNA (guanine966-N2)-methyltransferase
VPRGPSVIRNKVRIIGGVWRSRQIEFPAAEGLRPTPDRVRETLFNWLGQTLDGRTCLDLFAGSGALGFEALSRGARQVVMVEQNQAVLQALKNNAAKLGAGCLELWPGDALRFASQDRRQFDVIFLDPPYDLDLVPKLLPGLPALLAPGGMVYVEDDRALELPEGWEVWRSGHAGKVHFYLLRRSHGT